MLTPLNVVALVLAIAAAGSLGGHVTKGAAAYTPWSNGSDAVVGDQEPNSKSDPETADYIAKSGEFFQGELIVRSFTLPRGALVYVREDFTIDASGDILIAGTMVALPSIRGVDGPTIRIHSQASVQVTGLIHGAAGRRFSDRVEAHTGKQGGHGSDIVVEGPTCWISGAMVAGHGGASGAGGYGPAGGTALALGSPPAGAEALPPSTSGLYGGNGGRPGRGNKRLGDGQGGKGRGGGAAVSYTSRDEVPAEYRHLIE